MHCYRYLTRSAQIAEQPKEPLYVFVRFVNGFIYYAAGNSAVSNFHGIKTCAEYIILKACVIICPYFNNGARNQVNA
jgi:hypothetical protein